ncbi:MAG: hypothetical protein ABID38_02125 [Candidatus Diapherotrites archaeon]
MGSNKDLGAGVLLTIFAVIVILAVMDVIDIDAFRNEETLTLLIALLILALGVATIYTNSSEGKKVELEVTEATLGKH